VVAWFKVERRNCTHLTKCDEIGFTTGGDAISGIGVSDGIALGRAVVVQDSHHADAVEEGDILVTATTDPSWVSVIALAAALVIDIGGPTSHGAIVARELGVPCVINTGNGTRMIRTGDQIEVNGSTGSVTVVRRGPDST